MSRFSFGLRPVSRTSDGRFRVRLSDPVREHVVEAVRGLRALILANDVRTYRLFPAAYPESPELSEGYAALAKPELIDRYLSWFEVIESTSTARYLTEEQLLAWMRAINGCRLALGTAVGIDNDHEGPSADADRELVMTYELFGVLLEVIVAALSD